MPSTIALTHIPEAPPLLILLAAGPASKLKLSDHLGLCVYLSHVSAGSESAELGVHLFVACLMPYCRW